jgi:hypothetical protein
MHHQAKSSKDKTMTETAKQCCHGTKKLESFAEQNCRNCESMSYDAKRLEIFGE